MKQRPFREAASLPAAKAMRGQRFSLQRRRHAAGRARGPAHPLPAEPFRRSGASAKRISRGLSLINKAFAQNGRRIAAAGGDLLKQKACAIVKKKKIRLASSCNAEAHGIRRTPSVLRFQLWCLRPCKRMPISYQAIFFPQPLKRKKIPARDTSLTHNVDFSLLYRLAF